jgi:hypothetical protein
MDRRGRRRRRMRRRRRRRRRRRKRSRRRRRRSRSRRKKRRSIVPWKYLIVPLPGPTRVRRLLFGPARPARVDDLNDAHHRLRRVSASVRGGVTVLEGIAQKQLGSISVSGNGCLDEIGGVVRYAVGVGVRRRGARIHVHIALLQIVDQDGSAGWRACHPPGRRREAVHHTSRVDRNHRRGLVHGGNVFEVRHLRRVRAYTHPLFGLR